MLFPLSFFMLIFRFSLLTEIISNGYQKQTVANALDYFLCCFYFIQGITNFLHTNFKYCMHLS